MSRVTLGHIEPYFPFVTGSFYFETDEQVLPATVEFKDVWNCPSTSPYIFMVCSGTSSEVNSTFCV